MRCRGYSCYAAQQRNPALRYAGVQRDDVLSVEVERVWQANLQVYGAHMVWRQPRHEGTNVARCGVVPGKVMRTTVTNAAVRWPPEPVNRQFKAQRPNRLWVSDFTYVLTWQGFVYVAFVIDIFIRRVVG